MKAVANRLVHYVDRGFWSVFSVKLNSGVPIYRQVIEQVNRQIDRGQLEVGTLLPSVRQLAAELGVNPMTVSRAYSQLEADSVVERKRGIGMIVIRKAIRPSGVLKPAIKQIVSDAKQLGLTEKELARLIREQWKGK